MQEQGIEGYWRFYARPAGAFVIGRVGDKWHAQLDGHLLGAFCDPQSAVDALASGLVLTPGLRMLAPLLPRKIGDWKFCPVRIDMHASHERATGKAARSRRWFALRSR